MRKRRYPKTGAITFAQARMLTNDVGGRVYDAAVNLYKRGYTIHEAALLLGIKTKATPKLHPFSVVQGASLYFGILPTRRDNELSFT